MTISILKCSLLPEVLIICLQYEIMLLKNALVNFHASFVRTIDVMIVTTLININSFYRMGEDKGLKEMRCNS